jgi:hypothetical protein
MSQLSRCKLTSRMRGIKGERVAESTRIPWQKIYDVILCVRDSALRRRVYLAHKYSHQTAGAQTTLYTKQYIECVTPRRRATSQQEPNSPAILEASQDVVADPFLNPLCAALNELLIIKQRASRSTLPSH